MRETLLNHQQKPRPFGMKARRLSAVTRILMVLFAMMLFPMTLFSQGAIDPDYYEYDTQAGKFKKVTLNSYNLLSDAGNITDGYVLYTGRTYVSSGGDNFVSRVFIRVDDATKVINIVLRDGTSVMAMKGIDVPSGVTLNIYAQEAGTGELTAQGCYEDNSTGLGGTGYFYGAAIGGSYDTNPSSNYFSITRQCGTINIHGGQIEANSSLVDYAAGIGGCGGAGPVSLNIYGGKVTATGGKYGAGIGGGGIHGDSGVSSNGGTVDIYGGEVIATGGAGDASNDVAMGIGRGSVIKTAASGPSQGNLTINTGVIYYGGTTANPTNQIADNGTRFQYMRTIRSYDLWIGKNGFSAGTQVTAANASDLLGSLAGATGSMSFSPNTNTLILNNAAFDQNIISGLSDLTIELSGANSIILDGDTGTIIRSINANATLTFTHTGTADSLYLRHLNYYDNNTFSIISGFNSINYGTDLYMKSYSPTKYESYDTGVGAVLKSLLSAASRISRTSVDGTGGEEITYPCINSATITTTQTYPLWVTGVQVTADNISNILGTATPSMYYDDTNKILTLDGANIDYTGTDRNAVVSGIKELKVLLLNNNVISIKNNYNPTYPNYWRIFNYAFQYYAGTDGILTFILDEVNNSSLGQLTIENMEDPTSATDPQIAIGYAPFVAFGSIQQSVADLTTANTGSGWVKTTATTPNNGLTLSYSPDNYDLWVDGTRVNSFNAGNVFAGDATNDGKVSYVHDATNNTGTLKLNGLQITGDITSGLADLTIEISGDNTLHASSTASADGHIIGTATAGSLTFTKASGATGTSSLDLNAANSYSVIQGFTSVTAGNGIYFQYGNPYKYYTDSNDKNNNKMWNLDGYEVQGFLVTTQPSYPLWIGSPYTHGTFQAIDGSVTVAGEDIPFTVSGTTNTLTLNNENLDYYHIISGLDNLTIELVGTNTMNDSDPNVHSDVNPIIESFNNNATLTFKKSGTGTASLEMSNDASGSSIISGFSSVVAETGLFWTASGAVTYDSTNGLLVGTTPAHDATIGPMSYGLWVAGTQVTSDNATNVLKGDATNDQKVQYDATNQKLTLSGAKLSGAISTSMTNLTIHVEGECEINTTTSGNSIRSSANTGTLTFTKASTGGKLVLSTIGSSVIRGFNTLAGIPLITKTPYVISSDGTYSRLRDKLASDTSCVSYAIVEADQTYPLWIGIQQVTSDNISGFVSGTGTISYVPDTNTLTLNGASITATSLNSSVGYGIVTGDDLTVKLIGNNVITCSNAGDYAFKGCNEAASKITFATETSNPGLLTLNLKTDGNLFSNVTPAYVNDLNRHEDGSDGTYYVTRIVHVIDYPLIVAGTQVNSLNANDVLPTGPTAGKVKYVHDATNNTGTLTLDDVILDEGIYTTMADLTIHIKGAGCQISPLSTKNSNCIMSTANNGKLTFTKESGGKLILNNGAQHCSVIRGFSSLAGLPLETTKPYTIHTDGYPRLKDKLTPSTDTTAIVVAYIGADTTYPLWVSGVQVTSENSTDVLNYGTISFDGSSTLTLNGTHIYGSIVSDLTSLTISLLNDNTVENGILSSEATTSLTIAKDANATSDVSLLAKTATGSAIKGFGSILYTGLTPFSVDASDKPVTDITSSISYTSNALKLSGSDLSAVYFGIPTNMESASYTYSMGSKTYDGSAFTLPTTIIITETATNTNTTLTAGTDFTFTGDYKDSKKIALTTGAPKDAGSYYATIQGKNGYSGTVDVPFTIDPKTAVLSWDLTPLTYNGSPQAPVATVSNLAVSGETCNVTVTGQQTNAGTSYMATATALDNSNYTLPTTTADITKNFIISPCSLATASITSIPVQTYSGSAITPTPTVKIMLGNTNTTLTPGTDFDYTYSNNTDAALSSDPTAPPTVKITAKGNFEGEKELTFTIDPVDLSTSTAIDIDAIADKTYTGSPIMPTPTVTFNGNPLSADGNFSYGYTNNTDAALSTDTPAPTVTITGTGNFKNSRSVTFTIVPATITDVNVETTQFVYIPGETKTVNVTKVMAGSLILGTSDYDVAGNVQTSPGNYTLTVTGKGNFTGSIPVDWKITERVVTIDFDGRTYRTFYDAAETFLVPNDVTAYVVTGVSGSTVTVRKVSYIQVGVPVLLASTPGTTNTADSNETFAGNLLKYGTGAAQDKHYVLYNNEFVKATGDLTGKVYLDATGLVANARTLTVDPNNSATGLDAISDDEADGDQWFDVQGRKINKPTKAGLYIRNGQKVVIKNK